jgi:hypothetical protein
MHACNTSNKAHSLAAIEQSAKDMGVSLLSRRSFEENASQPRLEDVTDLLDPLVSVLELRSEVCFFYF